MFLCSTQIWAQCVKDYEPKSADEAEIVRIENEFCDAAIKRDASRLSEFFADDLLTLLIDLEAFLLDQDIHTMSSQFALPLGRTSDVATVDNRSAQGTN